MWSESRGRYGCRIRVFQPEPGGNIYYAHGDGRGGEKNGSLGHRDRKRAIEFAEELSAKFVLGLELPQTETLETGWRDYLRERSVDKTVDSQQHDRRVAHATMNFFGANTPIEQLTRTDFDRFIRARLSGEIDSSGDFVMHPERRQRVGERTVERDCSTLGALGKWLLQCGRIGRDPTQAVSPPRQKNPKRPVASDDRGDAIEAVADQVTTMVSWYAPDGGRILREVVSSFGPFFRLARQSGRRVTSLLRLQLEDIDWRRTPTAPWGSLLFRGEHDKQGKAWKCLMSAAAREAVEEAIARRPEARGWLFPSPRNIDNPLRIETSSSWLRRAEALAGLEPQEGGVWHPYRRAYAIKRKHLPASDVAQQGGWKNISVVQEVYMQADSATLLRVLNEPRELRELPVEGAPLLRANSTPHIVG
jgi:integrase